MNHKLFQEIKLLIINWVNENEYYFKKNNIHLSILRNEEDGFVVNFENNISTAEIVVEEPVYAPYRFVSFQIAAIKNNRAKIIYSFYDTDITSKKNIINELKKGIDYFINLENI